MIESFVPLMNPNENENENEIQLIEQGTHAGTDTSHCPDKEINEMLLDIDMETKQNVEQSWKDDQRAKLCDRVKYVLLACVGLVYFSYYCVIYNNESKNSVTVSVTETVNEYDAPYVIFANAPALDAIQLGTIANANMRFNSTNGGLKFESLTDFRYDSKATSWTVIYSETAIQYCDIVIAVPPPGNKITFGHFLQFELTTLAKCDSTDSDSASTHTPEENLLLRMLDQDNYGVYWVVDSVQYLKQALKTQNLTEIIMNFNFNFMNYAFVSSHQFVQLSVVENIDEWQDQTEYVFDFRISASKINKSLAAYLNVTEYCWGYANVFHFYISPKHTKTTIIKSKLKSATDILSGFGGIFSPLLVALTAAFGFLLVTKPCGCAKKMGLPQAMKLKTALYLQELGVLTSQQHQQAINNEKDGKANVIHDVCAP